MTRRPPFIPQKRPVYIGCEGASEASYAGLLQDMLREANQAVHLGRVDKVPAPETC